VAIDREKILQTAQKYIDKKKYDRAIEEYQRIVREDPKDMRTLLKIGDLQARMGSFADAVATYDRVGQRYSAEGFALKAISVYKQIRELIRKHAPELAERYAHITPKLAEIYTQLGLTSDALQTYDEVATRFQRLGRDRDAVEVFQKMVALDPNNPLPHLRLAEASCRIQQLDPAIDSFWAAAELLLRMQRDDDALKVIERILHFRQDPRYARHAAELYLKRGDRESGMQALTKLQICFRADPRNLDTLGLLARTFLQIGQDAKALEVYKEMARLAREQGRQELFLELVQHLSAVAPEDEQVQALQAVAVARGPSLQPAQPPPPAPVEEVEAVEEVEEVEPVEEVEAIDEVEEVEPVEEVEDVEEVEPVEEVEEIDAGVSSPDLVVVQEDQLEAAEEFGAPDRFDAMAHSRKAIADAESFRKLRLYPKAIQTLHIALEIDPRSVLVRDKLRSVLAEAGNLAGFIEESLTLAAILVEDRHGARAEAVLQEVLAQEPDHPTALQLLDQLAAGPPSTTEWRPHADMALPSYDLEEVAPESAMRGASADELDDPFAEGETSVTASRAPLAEELPSFGLEEEAVVDSSAIEDVLEEAEFYASHGLFSDARTILLEQLQRTPRHPLLRERLAEVESMLGGQPAVTAPVAPVAPAPAPVAFDLNASLDALDELGIDSGSLRPEAADLAGVEDDVDVEKVFAKFKEGVKAQVSDADSATHYDLGVAYREMGLLPDAIAEFELAAKDPVRQCMCCAMAGMIHLEQGDLVAAARSFRAGLDAQQKTADQEFSLCYELGNIAEVEGKKGDALSWFQRISKKDPNYRDVKQRIAALQPKPAAVPAPAQKPSSDDDEFDRMFDGLFDK